jgi:hypothetical protein
MQVPIPISGTPPLELGYDLGVPSDNAWAAVRAVVLGQYKRSVIDEDTRSASFVTRFSLFEPGRQCAVTVVPRDDACSLRLVLSGRLDLNGFPRNSIFQARINRRTADAFFRAVRQAVTNVGKLAGSRDARPLEEQ